MPLRCPRCDTLLDAFNRHGGPDGVHIEADMCLTCGGVWLDGGEAAAAYPGLSVLGARHVAAFGASCGSLS